MKRKIVIPPRPPASDVEKPPRERRTLGLRYGADAVSGNGEVERS